MAFCSGKSGSELELLYVHAVRSGVTPFIAPPALVGFVPRGSTAGARADTGRVP